MKLKRLFSFLLSLSLLFSSPGAAELLSSTENRENETEEESNPMDSSETEAKKKDFIKWVEFDIPYAALKKAMDIDIESHTAGPPIDWIELLAGLAAQYWGSWKRYRSSDMDKLASKLREGKTTAELYACYSCYGYYYDAYYAVLAGLVGPYQAETAAKEGELPQYESKYGLKAFSPIAKGYWYSHCRDFGSARNYGFSRRHLGNDLMGSVGTPIIAVESGVVEALGWNQYGGWRIGIRSLDGMRYYYYAHLRKNWPYVKTLKEGDTVTAGDVIGYLGHTGYSHTENVNNIKTPHLHFGLQLIFDESQKECNSEIWIDVYHLVELLSRHQSEVVKDPETKEYHRVQNMIDPELLAFMNNAEKNQGCPEPMAR
jgi:murein DD-endopeptidase MepM/ murein hydrolase activator NlpD